jgi:hypothetical protein
VNLEIILNEEEAEALDAILSREDGTWTPERARQVHLVRDRLNAAIVHKARAKMFKRRSNGGRHV